jgi:hypothetical protein
MQRQILRKVDGRMLILYDFAESAITPAPGRPGTKAAAPSGNRKPSRTSRTASKKNK